MYTIIAGVLQFVKCFFIKIKKQEDASEKHLPLRLINSILKMET